VSDVLSLACAKRCHAWDLDFLKSALRDRRLSWDRISHGSHFIAEGFAVVLGDIHSFAALSSVKRAAGPVARVPILSTQARKFGDVFLGSGGRLARPDL